jgi:alpha-tubulin suppressor-like RCC1 family protein
MRKLRPLLVSLTFHAACHAEPNSEAAVSAPDAGTAVVDSGQPMEAQDAGVERPPLVEDGGTLERFVAVQVEAGEYRACALGEGGDLYCWGLQRRVGTHTLEAGEPKRVAANAPIGLVATSGLYTVGAQVDGLLAFGVARPVKGFAASGSDANAPIQIERGGMWSALSVAHTHACGIREGEVWCWGTNELDRFGMGNTEPLTEPRRILEGNDWTALATTHENTCGVRAGALYCWGTNKHGQLGVGTLDPQPAPVRIGRETDWTQVVIADRCCGIRSGHLLCWGRTYDPEARDFHSVLEPSMIGTSDTWAMVSTSSTHTCAIQESSELFCWGLNTVGQLGDGSKIYRAQPTSLGRGWTDVTATEGYTCGVHDSEVYCWGQQPFPPVGPPDVEEVLPKRVQRGT